MQNQNKPSDLQNLPAPAADFIDSVIKKMRYRKKVRLDVRAELTAHFEDQLRDCTTDQDKQQKAQQLIADFGDPKLLAILLRRAKKRCRPLWRKALARTFQAFAVIVLYLLICTGPLLVGTPKIAVDYVDWLNELVRKGRDQSDNARGDYEKAVALYVKIPDCLSEAKRPEDLNDVETDSLSTWLEESEPAAEMLRQGARRPYYWNTYKSDTTDFVTGIMTGAMERLPAYKQLAYQMRWRIRYQVHNGNIDRALNDAVALLRFARHQQGHGLLIEQMIGTAIEALAHEEFLKVLHKVDVSAQALEAAQKNIQNVFSEPKQVISLEAEKAFWYDQIQRTFTDDGNGGGRVLIRGLPYAASDWKSGIWRFVSFSYPDRRHVVAEIEAHFERVAEFAEKTPWHLHAEGTDSDASYDILTDNLMLQILIPAHRRVAQLAWRLKTSRQALLTVLAVKRYKQKQGDYPADLPAVVAAGYLDKLPIDPYSDKPFVYRKTEDDFILYSVGLDCKDDAGESGKNSKGNPAKWRDKGDTVFWPALER